jgi:hypothetical protein
MKLIHIVVVLSILLAGSVGVIIYLLRKACSKHLLSQPNEDDIPDYMNNAVNYNPSICHAQMSSCLSNDNTNPDCILSKTTQTQAFFGYKINLLGTDPSVKGMNCGFEYDGTQVCKKDGKINNWNDQGRPVWVYFPNTVLYSRDISSIPYVIYFSFTQWNTTDTRAESLAQKGYGLFNPDRASNCTLGNPCGDAPMSPLWMQLQLQSFLAAGYAVVLTTMIADDSYIYQESCPPPLKVEDNLYNLCWNNGKNPDASYLAKIFHENTTSLLGGNQVELIPADPTLGALHPKAKDFYKNNPKLGNECGLIGYSVGAQMVSRCINEFGNINGVLKNAPDVAVACMVSGGSLHCYEYCNGDSTTSRGYQKTICNKQPTDWGPCWNKKSLGCCPEGLTEPRYDDPKNKDRHPPVILVQTDFDYYADPRASENYYRALIKMKAITEIVHGLCGNHNLFPAALLPVLTFFTSNMKSNLSSL